MKKKFTLMFVVFFFVMLVLPSNVLAKEDQGLQNAITKTKSLFEISNDYDTFNYSLQTVGGKTIYNLSWNDSKNKLGGVNVNIDSTGFVTNYWSYTPYNGNMPKKLPTLSQQDALQKATIFLEKVNPALKGKLKYQQDNTPLNIMDNAYNFRYVRSENNTLFPYHNVNVSVDRTTGEIQNLNCTWNTSVTFSPAEGTISLDKAKEIFKQELGLKLVYKFTYDGRQTMKPFLVYSVLNPYKFIDAKTGKIVEANPYYGYYDASYGMSTSAMKVPQQNIELTPAEKEAIESTEKLLSDKQAEEAARKFLQIDSSYKLANISMNGGSYGYGDYTWNMNFSKDASSFSAAVDAVTGEISYFYKYPTSDPKDEVTLDEAKSLEIAKQYLEKIQTELYKQVEYQPLPNQYYPNMASGNEKPREYSFNFTRKLNGIYVENNGFNITIDAVSGEVSHYDKHWYKGELPSTEKVLTSDAAYKVLFDTIGMQLQYIPLPPADAKTIAPSYDFTGTAGLVYSFNPQKPLLIDANTGDLLNYNGDKFVEYKPAAYSDIKGKEGENQIKVLAQYGITLPGDTFKPDQKITEKEFLYLLAKASTYSFDIKLGDTKSEDSLYNYLIGEGIVKEGEKNPNAAVTKETAVKFIIRAMKLEKVAQLKNIYTIPFKDKVNINAELSGYVALAYGLNIISAKDGYLYPKVSLTRSQGIILLYNYLNIE